MSTEHRNELVALFFKTRCPLGGPMQALRGPFGDQISEMELWWVVLCGDQRGKSYPMSRKALAYVPPDLRKWGKTGTVMIIMLMSWLVHGVVTSIGTHDKLPRPSDFSSVKDWEDAVRVNDPVTLLERLRFLADDMRWVFDQLPALFEKEEGSSSVTIAVPPAKRLRLDSTEGPSSSTAKASSSTAKAKPRAKASSSTAKKAARAKGSRAKPAPRQT